MTTIVDFRGISKKTHKLIFWKWKDGKLLPGSTKNFWEEVIPKTIGRWTLLKDKFRKKIYEKDVVSVRIKYETKTRHESEVGFNYNGFIINRHPAHIKLKLGLHRKLSDYCGRCSNDCYIVGNTLDWKRIRE